MRQAPGTKQTNRVGIWYLGNKIVNSIRLYQSGETHYIVTQDGEWTPIISCGLFVIVNQELLTFFQQQLEEQVSVMDVSIYDRVLDQFFDGYSRLYIPNAITPETIYTLGSLGRKIWCHRASGGIFISQEVKERLEQSALEGLEFHLGFSWYG